MSTWEEAVAMATLWEWRGCEVGVGVEERKCQESRDVRQQMRDKRSDEVMKGKEGRSMKTYKSDKEVKKSEEGSEGSEVARRKEVVHIIPDTRKINNSTKEKKAAYNTYTLVLSKQTRHTLTHLLHRFYSFWKLVPGSAWCISNLSVAGASLNHSADSATQQCREEHRAAQSP